MKTIEKILASSLLAVIVVSSCTNNYLEYNTNPYEVTVDQMSRDAYLTRSALTGMQGYVIPTDVNLNQFLEHLLGGPYGGYISESNQGFTNRFSNFNMSQDWLSKMYKDIIPNIYANYAQLIAATDDPIFLAVGDITRVAAVHRVTDTFGPIPYSKLGEDGNLIAPLDTQKDVYMLMISQLDAAVAALLEHRTETFSANADKIYAGSVIKWIRLANSLKLRLAMRMVYADPANAQKFAEEAVAEANGGVLGSNDDNALIQATNNPHRVIMYEYNGGDSRIAADITSYMNGYNDPRRPFYFTESTFTEADGVSANGYYGIRLGGDPIASEQAHKYSNMVVESSSKMIWMNAAEVAFLRAEGALRGWNMGGSAAAFYNEGIALSFEQWGAGSAETYCADATSLPQSYVDPLGVYSYTGSISSITISYDEAAEFETNLERIITQKWIANFPLGNEAWADFRRTGYPRLMPVPVNKNTTQVPVGTFPRRLTYPQEEYRENGSNVSAVLKDLSPATDMMSSRVWWDCNPNTK